MNNMHKKLDNCCYNQVKLLHEISKMVWFIEKHAAIDAQQAKDEKCFAALEDLRHDLEKHIEKIKALVCRDLK